MAQRRHTKYMPILNLITRPPLSEYPLYIILPLSCKSNLSKADIFIRHVRCKSTTLYISQLIQGHILSYVSYKPNHNWFTRYRIRHIFQSAATCLCYQSFSSTQLSKVASSQVSQGSGIPNRCCGIFVHSCYTWIKTNCSMSCR